MMIIALLFLMILSSIAAWQGSSDTLFIFPFSPLCRPSVYTLALFSVTLWEHVILSLYNGTILTGPSCVREWGSRWEWEWGESVRHYHEDSSGASFCIAGCDKCSEGVQECKGKWTTKPHSVSCRWCKFYWINCLCMSLLLYNQAIIIISPSFLSLLLDGLWRFTRLWQPHHIHPIHTQNGEKRSKIH